MPIFYSVVARGTIVLAEHSSKPGNVSSIAKKILETIPTATNVKKTYVLESYYFHYEVEDGLTFLCLTDEAFGRSMPFLFLDDVKKRFLSEWGSKWRNAIAFSAQTEFGRTLKQLGDYYSNNVNADRILKVQGAIGEVRDQMLDNIEKVLARGERIEDTVQRTGEMANNALNFKKAGTSLKRSMWFKNMKLWFILGGLAIIVIYVIAAIICKSPIFKNCPGKKKPATSDAIASTPAFLVIFASLCATLLFGL